LLMAGYLLADVDQLSVFILVDHGFYLFSLYLDT